MEKLIISRKKRKRNTEACFKKKKKYYKSYFTWSCPSLIDVGGRSHHNKNRGHKAVTPLLTKPNFKTHTVHKPMLKPIKNPSIQKHQTNTSNHPLNSIIVNDVDTGDGVV